jgi:lipoic acid synthetase
VKAGQPAGVVDWNEPERLARAAAALQLHHVVITSVARDDLDDGGASVFAECIRQLRLHRPGVIAEVLTPDFNGDPSAISTVLNAQPDIYNHNIETVERLTPRVRSRALYHQSLEVLRYAKAARAHPSMKTKSGMMLGLGETREEIRQTLADLRSVGCDYLTIGQYLQPSARHLTIQSFAPVEDFEHWKEEAFLLGFERVASVPLVRSSYFADQLHEQTSDVLRTTFNVPAHENRKV